MKKIDNLKITKSLTINEALKTIDSGGMKIALVVDKKGKLLATLTDGDIRRGLLKGLDLNSSIENITFKTPVIAKISDTKKDILKLALSKKLQQIPIVDKNGKVVGMHEIEEIIRPQKKTNKVVLMVGGIGKRLRPLTENTPKAMLKIGNKPILQTIVEKFAECGYVNIVMCVNFKSKVIKDYFGDGSKFGVNIEYILEKKKIGNSWCNKFLKR